MYRQIPFNENKLFTTAYPYKILIRILPYLKHWDW